MNKKTAHGALTLVLSVDYRMGTPDKPYRIELYNPDLSENDKGYYNIRRNTVYQMCIRDRCYSISQIKYVIPTGI